jgi:hypothetical protein
MRDNMYLDSNILKSINWKENLNWYSCWNAKGLYNSFQFALKLRPDIQRKIESINMGIKDISEVEFKEIEAFSTYFHETIHWWQHIGSISGFVLSLIYPAQSHVNHKNLVNFLNKKGPLKSIIKYDELFHGDDRDGDTIVNQIINNWIDMEFFRNIIINPHTIKSITKSAYFESVGHSYYIAIGSAVWLLATIFDHDLQFLPDVRTWEKEMLILRQKKTIGYYYGSDVMVPNIGLQEIYEGQARFSQIQYLYLSSEGKLSWDDFKQVGMLDGIYIQAFEFYLKMINEQWPSSPDDSSVGLFLLLCDLSINPTEGFPFNIIHHPSFMVSVDPGTRFIYFCQIIRQKHSELSFTIVNYSKEEYEYVCSVLCNELCCKTPSEAAKEISRWSIESEGIKRLMQEEKNYTFEPQNMPIRLLFANFINFQIDKYRYPEYFCWPGIWSVSNNRRGIELEEVEKLFDKHSALFMDGIDGDLYSRKFTDKKDENVEKTFNEFYSWNITYDLVRQWISQEGEFQYKYSWLTTKYPFQEIVSWANHYFKEAYSVSPEQFKIL